MAFNFKREFGVSDIIAGAALVVSIYALWQTSGANDPYLLVGNGPVMAGVFNNPETNKCEFVAQVPVTIDNSGKKSIIFERLIQDRELPPVLYSKHREFLSQGDIPYEIYLTQFNMRSPTEWEHASQTALKLDIQAAEHISQLIKPGHSLDRWLVIKSPVRGTSNIVPTSLYIALLVEFSNGEHKDIRAAINLPELKHNCIGSKQ